VEAIDKVEGFGETPVRGTQSLVQTMGRCWKRPSLTGLEVLWRWVYGVPGLAVVVWHLKRILAAHTGGTFDVARLGLDRALVNDPVGAAAADPLGVTGKVSEAVRILLPDLRHLALWLGPLLLVVWVVVSAVGRTAVLRKVDGRLHARMGTLMGLQAIRTVALLGSFAVWFACLRWAANVAVNSAIAAGREPNLVLYFAILIVSTLGLFTLWAVVSWALSVAPLLAMLRGIGVGKSLVAAFRLGAVKSKLVEVNLVLGIVKIALIVLAMVFSATPVPFSSVTTPEFLMWWWAGVVVLYLIGSDFFHVTRLMAYLGLWRAFEAGESFPAE
jgi:hypothetical protein